MLAVPEGRCTGLPLTPEGRCNRRSLQQPKNPLERMRAPAVHARRRESRRLLRCGQSPARLEEKVNSLRLPSVMPALRLRPRSLRFKLIALCVAIAGSSALAVAWVCTQFQARALKDASYELQLSLVREVAHFAQLQDEQTQRDFQALARALTQSDWGDKAQLTVAFALLESMPRLDELRIYDASGRFIDRISQGDRPVDRAALPPEMQDAAVQAGTWTKAEILTGSDPRQLWVQSLRVQGQLTGFLASPVRLTPLQQHLRSTASLQLANTPHALYISDLQGNILLSSAAQGPFASGHKDHQSISLELGDLSPELGVAKDLPPSSEQDPAQLATALRLSSYPWVVMVKVPAPAAFAPLHELRAQLQKSVVLILAVSMLVAFALSRRVSRPLTALVAMAQRLEQGRFDHTALLRRKDELGEVARAMSLAAKDLALHDLHSGRDTHDNAAPASQTRKRKPS